MGEKADDVDAQGSSSQANKGKGKRRKREENDRLPPEKLIRSLVWALQGEALELAFPYLVVHQCCWKMLRAVREACDPVLRERYPAACMENETELPFFVVGYILMANSGMGGQPPDDRLLRAAADALDPFAATTGKEGLAGLSKICSKVEVEKEDEV